MPQTPEERAEARAEAAEATRYGPLVARAVDPIVTMIGTEPEGSVRTRASAAAAAGFTSGAATTRGTGTQIINGLMGSLGSSRSGHGITAERISAARAARIGDSAVAVGQQARSNFLNVNDNLKWLGEQSLSAGKERALFAILEDGDGRVSIGGQNFSRAQLIRNLGQSPAAFQRYIRSIPEMAAPARAPRVVSRDEPQGNSDRDSTPPRVDRAADVAAGADASPPPSGTTADSDAAAVAPEPQPAPAPPPPQSYVDQALGLMGGDDPNPVQAGQTLATGLVNSWEDAPEDMADQMTVLMSENPDLAREIAREMMQNRGTVKSDLETDDGSIPVQTLMERYPVLGSAYISSMARSNPDQAYAFINGATTMQLSAAYPDNNFGQTIMSTLEANPAAKQQMMDILRDPDQVQNLMNNMGMLSGSDGASMDAAGMTAVMEDFQAKPQWYLSMLSSDNPIAMANGMSDEAYAALASTQQPSGLQGFLMRMMLGSDFDPADPANRNAVVAMSAQFGAIKDAIGVIGDHRDLIVANGGESSFGLSSIGNYIDAVTDPEYRDDLLAGADTTAANRWAAAHNISDFSDAQYYNVETGDIGPAPADQPIQDGPGNRDLPRRIETVDPNAAGGFG